MSLVNIHRFLPVFPSHVLFCFYIYGNEGVYFIFYFSFWFRVTGVPTFEFLKYERSEELFIIPFFRFLDRFIVRTPACCRIRMHSLKRKRGGKTTDSGRINTCYNSNEYAIAGIYLPVSVTLNNNSLFAIA